MRDASIRILVEIVRSTLLCAPSSETRPRDYAATVQKVLEDVMLQYLRRLLAKNPARHLGLSGGVFSNVKLNRLLAEALDLDEVYIFPAMGDDGLPVGGALAWLMQRDGPAYWLEQRRDLGDVIWDEIFLPQPMLKLAAHRASGAFRSRRLMAPRGA